MPLFPDKPKQEPEIYQLICHAMGTMHHLIDKFVYFHLSYLPYSRNSICTSYKVALANNVRTKNLIVVRAKLLRDENLL